VEQSLSEADSRLACQEFPRILWNPIFHYRVDKRLLMKRVLSQMNPEHVLTSYLLKIRLNVILPYTIRCPGFLICSIHATWSTLLILLDSIILITYNQENKL